MSAVTATAPARTARPEAIPVYRDDGPIARWIGRAVGSRVALPPLLLAAAGVVPLLAVAAAGGDEVSRGVAAATIAWVVLCCGLSRGRRQTGRLSWMLPSVVRLGEYAGLLWIGTIAGASSLPAALALLGAIAYRNYDLVYRLRHRGVTPAPWVSALSGGWDGRLIGACVLLLAGALPAGYFVVAAVFGVVFLTESATAWKSTGRGQQPLEYEDEEDEGQ